MVQGGSISPLLANIYLGAVIAIFLWPGSAIRARSSASRFTRDVYVHSSLKQLLMKSGAKLRAATQPLEDSAAGRAIEGFLPSSTNSTTS